eukprot:CAMPEP_0181171498 /NCGR_PEP_ID=MMETSP1096-20121128/1941_1 /TAXON_ID=156174 ORGANISM="Chrysochromulina ericina, Strain CCMP281" /NCGR_SAMPLE_ID=MMETSP1096 /ASSEMBLY_ACC=CAM_ASM_000453 /LENGTH=110 /DNA_ID=CAMNT_0023259149 /DNA_START=116 /DNA_END=449 /DNA_ORIENTATION=+
MSSLHHLAEGTRRPINPLGEKASEAHHTLVHHRKLQHVPQAPSRGRLEYRAHRVRRLVEVLLVWSPATHRTSYDVRTLSQRELSWGIRARSRVGDVGEGEDFDVARDLVI